MSRSSVRRLFAPSAASGADSAPPPPLELPVKLELASGTGDWVAAQAAADAGAANWVACAEAQPRDEYLS